MELAIISYVFPEWSSWVDGDCALPECGVGKGVSIRTCLIDDTVMSTNCPGTSQKTIYCINGERGASLIIAQDCQASLHLVYRHRMLPHGDCRGTHDQ